MIINLNKVFHFTLKQFMIVNGFWFLIGAGVTVLVLWEP